MLVWELLEAGDRHECCIQYLSIDHLWDRYWNGHSMHRMRSNTNTASASLPNESRSQLGVRDDRTTTQNLDVDIETTRSESSQPSAEHRKRTEDDFPLIWGGGGCYAVVSESIQPLQFFVHFVIKDIYIYKMCVMAKNGCNYKCFLYF